MFKRLIIAVLALGLILAFSGTAISGIGHQNDPSSQYNPVNPNHPRSSQVVNHHQLRTVQIPANRLGNNLIQSVPSGTQAPSHAHQGTYTSYNNGTPAFYWRLPDNVSGAPYEITLPSVRFATAHGQTTTLHTASVLVYRTQVKGNPGMRVYLYNDNGFGFPGAKLDSVTFPQGSFSGTGLAWADADFSARGWVFENGAQYHYGITAITDSPDDSLAFVSDNGTNHSAALYNHNNAYLSGTGYNYPVAYSDIWNNPVDYGFFIESEAATAQTPLDDCHTQNWDNGPATIWAAPDGLYGDSAYSERFTASGPETLESVDFYVYHASPDPELGGSYAFGNNTVRVKVYADNGFGKPGTLLATVLKGPGTYPAFPTPTNAVFAPLVLPNGDFHVALSTNAVQGVDCEVFIGDDGSTGANRSNSAWNPGTWTDMNTGWGADYEFSIYANLCHDPYGTCTTTVPYTFVSNIQANPGPNDEEMYAQQFSASGGPSCEIRTVSFTFGWGAPADAGRAAKMYKTNTEIRVYSDAGGTPGSVLGTITLTPADYAAMGNVGYTGSTYLFSGSVDFGPLHVALAGPYWIAIHSNSSIRDSGIRVACSFSAGSGAGYVGQGMLFSPLYGGWYAYSDFYAGPPAADAATDIVSSSCCTAFSERTCSGTSDWPRWSGNDASDGTSQVALSDSWCDLNRIWSYSEFNALAATVSGVGPIIYEGKVVANFFDRYEELDITTGANIHTWGPGGTGITGGFTIGTQLAGSGAIYVVGGVKTLFIGGGTNNNLIAINWNTGNTIWGVAVGPNQGPVRGGAFMVLTQGGTPVLYYTTNSGNTVARNALTGALYAPYGGTGIVALNGNSSEVTGANDGTDVYYSTNPAAPLNGSIYRINAANGTIVWSLAAGNLKGTVAYPSSSVTREIFNAGVSVDASNVYAISQIAAGSFPADGVYYKLNSGTGAVVGFSAAEGGLRQPPIIDQNHVYVMSSSSWGGGSFGNGTVSTVFAFSKSFSSIDWVALHPESAAQRARAGALSCEPGGVDDKLYVVTDRGWLFVYNTSDGDEIFQRRWEDLAGGGTNTAPRGIAIGNGPYVTITSRNQYMMTLTKGADRPRLELQTFNPSSPADFGTNPAFPLNLGPIITNTGCTPLHIGTVTADANPFVARIPAFSIKTGGETQAMSRAGNIANLITQSSFSVKGVTPAGETDQDNLTVSNLENRDQRNRAASAPPAFLVSVAHPASGDVVNPGDTMDLQIVIDQNQISRGPQSAYVQVASDDPDYFLNDPSKSPQFKLTLIGGCVLDTAGLQFGIGSANLQLVWNSGRIGDGELPGAYAFLIDGAGTTYYQGSYVYAMSQRRWAVSTKEWFSNVTGELVSLQADPNWCDTSCKPLLTSPYNVGSISTTGLVYTPISANMVCRSYLDSVQNFFNGSTWDVQAYEAGPFDNDSTIGLYVRSHVVGAVNEPTLANVTVDIMTLTERNGRAVPNWFMGSMNDYDLGSDTSGLDASISTAYDFHKTGAAGIWGQIKLPFGCGQTGIRNIRGLGGAQAFFAGSGVGLNAYFDSTYQFMQAPQSTVSSQAAPNGSDYENHITYVSHSFTPSESYTYAVAFFGFPNGSNTGTTTSNAPSEVKDLARQVNKWTGWGRGDVNNDNVVNLADIVYLAGYVNFSGPGPIPFLHLGDVDASGGNPNQADVTYLINYYFNCGPCPNGAFVF